MPDQPSTILILPRKEAELLRREMEDLAQAWPSSTLLTGDSPFGLIYQELSRVLDKT